MDKRVISIFSILTLCFLTMMLRVWQLASQDTLKQAAAVQNTLSMEIDKQRGAIYDCNMKPLVSVQERPCLAVVPCKEAASTLLPMTESLSERQALLKRLQSATPFVVDIDAPYLQSKGVETLTLRQRYSDSFLYPHIIGYTNYENHGVSGIEWAYDSFLYEGMTTTSISYTADALGRPLAGYAPKVIQSGGGKSGVVLAIDDDLQRIAAQCAQGSMEKGAVVIMDVQTGKVRAMVSLPWFDPNAVEKSLDDPNAPLINRCTSAYNVGSIFKIVTAACALENGIPTDTEFYCPGYVDVEGQVFGCHDKAGHGWQDMKGAFEVSCNPYFINLSLQLGAAKLYKTAYALGFGQADEFAMNLYSAAGTLPKPTSVIYNAQLANIGFGQGELTATPLQIAKLLSAVANGGKRVTPSLVEGFSDEQGEYVKYPESHLEPETVLSESTAALLQAFCKGVVQEGSGKRAMPELGGAGGKTGSAQTGSYDENGEEIVQAWFGGFYPADTPRYAIVVLNEGANSGALYAAPVFKNICDLIDIHETMP